MSTSVTPEHAPIYELLVLERGDVLTESRKAAERTHARARQTLNWSGRRASSDERTPRAPAVSGGREPVAE